MKKLIFVLFIAFVGCKEEEIKPITGTWRLYVQNPQLDLVFTADKVGGEYVFEVVTYFGSEYTNTSMVKSGKVVTVTIIENNDPNNKILITMDFGYDGNSIILNNIVNKYYVGEYLEDTDTVTGKVKATRLD